jgi:SAM-dependent methyltransferase
MPAPDVREQNRRSWNAIVPVHDSHRGDQAAFFRQGGSTIFPEERALLGNLAGLRVVHLQCNTGQDTLSLAGLGAEVTGVDISDAAIGSAQALSVASGIPATFERADIEHWLRDAAGTGRRFDVAFSSYGVICWLPDLASWAAGIAGVLKPGGRFVLVEFHPVASMFDEHWRHASPYPAGGEPLDLPGVGDYVGDAAGGLTPAGHVEGVRGFANPEPCRLFRWGLGEVVTALAGAGLTITELREYPYANGERQFTGMRELPGRRMTPPEDVPALPLMYGLAAVAKDLDG